MEHIARPVRTQRQQPIRTLLYPISAFMHAQASGGIILMLSAVIALIWANSPWGDAYVRLWETRLTIGPEGFAISKDLLHWINDGLMAVFFFVVGLEIKREVLVGELASLRQAALPIAAALGGMVAPALIYLALTAGGEGAGGWGVPMATDIAFALGVLALLGRRAPLGLRVFLTALAIVDDLGAVLVIAIFYTQDVSWMSLGVGALFLAALVITNKLYVRSPIPYALLGIGLWVAFLVSGVHATIAGVLLAMTIPARTRVDTDEFLQRARTLLEDFDRAGEEAPNILTNEGQQAAIMELETACEQVQTPMQRLEHSLHPWVAFAIVPLFALANAGVELGGGLADTLTQPITLGIIAGLVLGKQIGIVLLSWLAVRSGLAFLPMGVTWRHIYGVSWLAGIGFTMSLFIASLAFGSGTLLASAKTGILAASLIAGVVGYVILRSSGTDSVAADESNNSPGH